MQLLIQFQQIFVENEVPVILVPYRIFAITPNSGFIEPIPSSISLDSLKKRHLNLLNFFVSAFGEPSEISFKQAQLNFVKTMAAYSMVCYLLQIKDRYVFSRRSHSHLFIHPFVQT
jgi:phosphatidylinositol 4-kinase